MPSEKKKNPPLAHLKEGWNAQFISPYSYLLDYKGFLNFSWDMPKKKLREKRKIFDTYPIYLQHTLFHNEDETMMKVRKLEVSSRFFAYEKFRERGNKCLYKQEFEDALIYYERALSCFKWLELKPEDSDDDEENAGVKTKK